MIPERAKAFLLPLAALALLEIWARATQLQSDSLAPPTAVAAALELGEMGGIKVWMLLLLLLQSLLPCLSLLKKRS